MENKELIDAIGEEIEKEVQPQDIGKQIEAEIKADMQPVEMEANK